MSPIEKSVFFREVTDEQINQSLDRLIKGRALNGFDAFREAEALAAQVDQTKLSSGSDDVSARALAWCARILSSKDALRAQELLKSSRAKKPTAEAVLAESFLIAQTDKAAALLLLDKQAAPASRSAALRVVANADGAEAAVAWTKSSGLTIDSFDADGKSTYLMNALAAGELDLAIAAAEKVREEDFTDFPVLLHGVALANLIVAVPAREVGPDLAALLSAAKSKSDGGNKTVVVHSGPIHKIGSLMNEEADLGDFYLSFLFSILRGANALPDYFTGTLFSCFLK